MIKMLIGFRRRQGMSMQEFKDYRRDIHAPLLFNLPEADKIRRFVVSYPVAAPGWPEPTFDAVVEACFDSLDDLNALYTCEAFQEVVDPDHANFIDLASVSRIVSEEIVVVG